MYRWDMSLQYIVETDAAKRAQALQPFVLQGALVDSALQIRVQRTFAQFWQERLVSLQEPDAPKVLDPLTRKHFLLQSMLRVEHEPLSATHPELLRSAQAFFDLSDELLTRKLISLSNGELRRILVARAYMQNVRCIVLDDPLGGLDPAHRISMQNALQTLSDQGLQIIVGVPEQEQILSDKPSAALALLANNAPSNGAELLRLDAITVRFGETVVLHELDWVIRSGEHWLLTGPNGSGKSTLLAILTADHPQIYRNRVTLLGQIPGQGLNVWEHKRNIGFCSPELHHQWTQDLTLFELVCTGFLDPRSPYGEVLWEQKLVAQEALQRLNMDGNCRFLAATYTEQRLALVARAIVRHPRLLILDEPDQGLDAQGRTRLWEFIDKHLQQSSSTLILATHHAQNIPQSITHALTLASRRP